MAKTMSDGETAVVVREDNQASDRIGQLHLMAGRHAEMAVYCAAAAGAIMLLKKQTLEHGQFAPWVETLVFRDGDRDVLITPRTAQRYMLLAQQMAERIKALPAEQQGQFLESLGGGEKANATRVSHLPALPVIEILARLDPTKLGDLRAEQAKEIIRAVTRESSLRQLYFDWGIMRAPPAPTRGQPGRLVSAGEAAEISAKTDWDAICKLLSRHGYDKRTRSWPNLPTAELERVVFLLDEISGDMRRAIAGRKKK